MPSVTRRNFIISSALATLGLATGKINSRIPGSNADVRIGLIGLGIKGTYVINDMLKIPGVRIVALADPDPDYKMAAGRDELARRDDPIKVDMYTDYRRLLDREDIDAVIISSCNHWHSLHTIHALQAGKHVYTEKPVSHDIWQGRQMVKYAKKSGLVVAAGLQHRSRECWPEVMDYLKEGHLGKIICARGLCYKRRKSIGMLSSPLKPPVSCDYNLWLGPAQNLPLMRPQFHYDWHWVWNTGNGDIGNQGPHQLDIGRWLIGEKSLPERVFSIGGRFGYRDAGETPNTQFIYYDYKPIPLIFEVRGLPDKPGIEAMPIYKNSRINTLIECEGGYISDAAAYDNDNKLIKHFSSHGEENHFPNFINAVRNEKPDSVACSIEDGHISSALCHIGNISHRVGRTVEPDEIYEKVKINNLQNETWQRFTEHLSRNNVDIQSDKVTLGKTINFDPVNERFTGSGANQANALVRDSYRKEWAIPEFE